MSEITDCTEARSESLNPHYYWAEQRRQEDAVQSVADSGKIERRVGDYWRRGRIRGALQMRLCAEIYKMKRLSESYPNTTYICVQTRYIPHIAMYSDCSTSLC